MDIQLMKMEFIEEFIALRNESVIKKLSELLKQEKKKIYEAGLKPMTEYEFIQRIDLSEKDITESNIIDHEDLKKESENW